MHWQRTCNNLFQIKMLLPVLSFCSISNFSLVLLIHRLKEMNTFTKNQRYLCFRNNIFCCVNLSKLTYKISRNPFMYHLRFVKMMVIYKDLKNVQNILADRFYVVVNNPSYKYLNITHINVVVI